MKNYCFPTAIFFLFTISPSVFAMDLASFDLGKVNSTVFVTERIVAVGSDLGCFLIFDPARPTERKEKIHSIPTSNLFTDKKNRIGVLCQDSFAVYDVTTKKRVWSQTVYGPDCYAAFNHVDDTIFLYRQGEFISDIEKKEFASTLAYTGNNNHFSFACHPKKPEIAYPCSNESFIIRQFNTRAQPKRYLAKINKDNYIRRIFYSPDGSRIMLHTEQGKLYMYDLSTKKTLPFKNGSHECYSECHNPMFFPGTNNIMTFICKEGYIHYYDLRNDKEITSTQLKIETPFFTKENFLVNILDISPYGTQLATCLNMFDVNSNPVGNIRHLAHKYALLKQHFSDNYFPLEVVALIAKFLSAFYPFHVSE